MFILSGFTVGLIFLLDLVVTCCKKKEAATANDKTATVVDGAKTTGTVAGKSLEGNCKPKMPVELPTPAAAAPSRSKPAAVNVEELNKSSKLKQQVPPMKIMPFCYQAGPFPGGTIGHPPHNFGAGAQSTEADRSSHTAFENRIIFGPNQVRVFTKDQDEGKSTASVASSSGASSSAASSSAASSSAASSSATKRASTSKVSK